GREHLARHFRDEILPLLTPLAAAPGHPFPHIPNFALALAVRIRDPATEARHFVAVTLPASLPRFIPLPDAGVLVPLESVVCANIKALFPGVAVERAHAFRVTRSADIRYQEDRARDLLLAVEEEIADRPYLPVVRVEVERTMPPDMRALLLQEFRFEGGHRVSALGMGDVYEFEWLAALRGLGEVADALAVPVPREGGRVFPAGASVLDQVREGDVLVHFPFDSFRDSVERFLSEAADDPAVEVIKVTLYRTEDRSDIRPALKRAASRGKSVSVLLELKARFDETHNIGWARELRAAGVNVVHGVPSLKVHAKLALVVRRERGAARRYAYVGTGNFHRGTADLYTDLGLFSADPVVAGEVNGLFNELTGLVTGFEYQRLLVAPDGMLPALLERIERATEFARAGRPARIRAKLNGLDDLEVVQALYEAAQAGVRISLVVRGICCLVPGVAGVSDRIEVVSILGPLLEHARILHFQGDGTDEYFIGSADWRSRNLRRRVEVYAPVTDPSAVERLDRLLTRQLADPTAWVLGPDGAWRRRTPHGTPVRGVQDELLAEASRELHAAPGDSG
ncbi:MAG: polyphosphate kinase 1, partial [Longimicrobiales bacterium]|nr:polyphosphate kinase 1 [Longimicrobiales bacterium]